MTIRCEWLLRFTLGVLVAAGASACERPGVSEIKSTPITACTGTPITIEWSLRGDGVLSATPPPEGWADSAVKGSGQRRVAIGAGTTFTLYAAAAPPEKQKKEVYVPVVDATGERTVSATCGVDGRVRGTLGMGDLPEHARVAELRNPVGIYAGVTRPIEICVSHLSQSRCVKPGEAASFPAPARGDWQFELPQVLGDGCPGQPSQLGIELALECGSPSGDES